MQLLGDGLLSLKTHNPRITKQNISCTFLDKYVSCAERNHYFLQWSKSNRTKTFMDKVTVSDIAYMILVYENSKEVWEEQLLNKEQFDIKLRSRQNF